MDRPEQLFTTYPTLFDSEREKRLPRWAQIKLIDLRYLLVREASETDHLREEIKRLDGPKGDA